MPRVKLGKTITPAQRREAFNRVVEHAMIDAGIKTQEQLGRLIGMTRAAVSRRFTGETEWSYLEICKLIEALKIGPEGVMTMMVASLCAA
ncbi:helix-turn-helix domain-containing protein [Dysosmobacter sp.]